MLYIQSSRVRINFQCDTIALRSSNWQCYYLGVIYLSFNAGPNHGRRQKSLPKRLRLSFFRPRPCYLCMCSLPSLWRMWSSCVHFTRSWLQVGLMSSCTSPFLDFLHMVLPLWTAHGNSCDTQRNEGRVVVVHKQSLPFAQWAIRWRCGEPCHTQFNYIQFAGTAAVGLLGCGKRSADTWLHNGWNLITVLICERLAGILRFFSDFLQLVGAPLQKAGTIMM